MPRFSILTPVYRPPARAFRDMLASVNRQTFGDWEHCLVDDRSADPQVQAILEEAASSDARVRVSHREHQGGIVAATNDALRIAGGDYVAFLDHDDELHVRALETMAAAIEDKPEADYLYSDEDKIDERSRHFSPFVKPAWSPDRLCSQMYVTHFRVIRRRLVEELGGFRPGFEGSQDWDLALRAAEQSACFVRVPGLLYHWRTVAGSAAGAEDAKPWAHASSQRALAEHIERVGVQATVEGVAGYPGHYWLRPALVDTPLVSIVIPTTGRARVESGPSGEPLAIRCVRSVVERSTYENYELVVVLDADASKAAAQRLQDLAGNRLKLVEFEGSFNFSAKVNRGVQESRGEQVLLLNDDVEVPLPGWTPARGKAPHVIPEWHTSESSGRRFWIESLLVYAMQTGIGAAGAKLYFPDGRLQHGGIICREGRPAHPYYLEPGDTAGYASNLVVASNFLAVTAACLMTPRSAFEAAGGFDEDLPVNYNDVDYCLRLRRVGLRSVLVPHVELLHAEALSRGGGRPGDAEVRALRGRWDDLLYTDPYYPDTFIDDDFTLPALSRRGEWRATTDPLSFLDKIRRAHAAGGLRLVARRSYDKVHGRVRRRFTRRFSRNGAS